MSNLAGTTWIFKDEIDLTTSVSFNILSADDIKIFESNNTEYKTLQVSNGVLKYGYTSVYNGSWTNDAYKTITFIYEPNIFGPDETIALEWLEENTVHEDTSQRYITTENELKNIANAIRSKISDSSIVESLVGTSWTFNNTVSLTTPFSTIAYELYNDNVFFKCDGANYKMITPMSGSSGLLYVNENSQSTSVYSVSNGWTDNKYKTITFVADPTITTHLSTIVVWLNANATYNGKKMSYPNGFTDTINNIVTLEDGTADANATAADILSGKTAYVNGQKISGSYTLAGHTAGTATANNIESGKTAWVNGVKLTGTHLTKITNISQQEGYSTTWTGSTSKKGGTTFTLSLSSFPFNENDQGVLKYYYLSNITNCSITSTTASPTPPAISIYSRTDDSITFYITGNAQTRYTVTRITLYFTATVYVCTYT